jgi:transcriptional regulator with XRE-family HTH domain
MTCLTTSEAVEVVTSATRHVSASSRSAWEHRSPTIRKLDKATDPCSLAQVSRSVPRVDSSSDLHGASWQADSSPVGDRLRGLRIGRRLTLKEVAARAGVTEGFLSQVERGRSSPSLKTLQAVARAMGLEAGDVFETAGRELPHLVPRNSRGALEVGPISKYRVSPTSITGVEVIGGIFQPDASAGDPYTHGDSDEVCVVISGNIVAEVDGQAFEMKAGDSLSYRSSMLHTFRALDEPSEVLWIISPPSW